MLRSTSYQVQHTLCFKWHPVEFQEMMSEDTLHDIKSLRQFLQKLIVRSDIQAQAFVIHMR